MSARQQDGSALRTALERARATLVGLSLPLGTTREVAQHERGTALALIDEVLDSVLAALPPSAPPALDVDLLQDAMARTAGGPWESDYAMRTMAAYARLKEAVA